MIKITKKEFKNGKNNIVLKEIIFKEQNEDILVSILETIFKRKIEIISKCNSKTNKLDFTITTNVGIINLKTNSNNKYLNIRNTAFLCDIYRQITSINTIYSDKQVVNQVNLTYDIEKKKQPITEYKLRNKNGTTYIDNLRLIEINMEFFKKMWLEKENYTKEIILKYKYIIMLTLDKEDLNNFSRYVRDEKVNKYMEQLDELNFTKKYESLLSEEQEQKKILETEKNKSEKEGYKRGLKTKSIEIAKKMIKSNLDINTITKLTGLDRADVRRLLNN